MLTHVFVLIAVMLMAGLFGGLVNYYLHGQHDPDVVSLPRSLVVGGAASFMVPVVLSLLGSDLISASEGDPGQFVLFAGFCLIAALASRVFIISTTDRIMETARSARERSEALEHQMHALMVQIAPMIESETENESTDDDNHGAVPLPDEVDVTATNVLKSLGTGRYIFRSLRGLSTDTDYNEGDLVKTLNLLASRGLAGRVNGLKGVRWYVTEQGRRFLQQII
ncbi:YEATS-associated helix-containing protein [Salinispirillum marinum]|uniref:YEATS-associated helix-containing protein n=2 Tax=Saccharospirillaceae TaxID=255527 RepID=A0ABV8BFT9_9GAMM